MDISKLIQASGLRFDFVAEKLFPSNKHPYNALLRLIKKDAELSESQILTLAEILGATPNDILNCSDSAKWAGTVVEEALVFRKGEFTAEYSTQLATYSLYRKKEYLGTFAVQADLSVKGFIEELNKQISNPKL